ncbi:MAG: hypothetical protein JO001_02730 [Alphaproteobacteria bacterium]|nr:hypothetical protein [Alphaproteobacteria bacterium]
MLRGPHFIVAGIITMLVTACVPTYSPAPPAPAPAPASPPPFAHAAADIPCSDGSSITSKVVELAAAYDPANNGTSPPQAGGLSTYGALVQSAFNLAPQDLRNRLCALDHIYIDQFDTDHSAWGIRDRKSLKRHIGISKKLLDSISSSTITYADYETEILHRLLWKAHTPEPTWLQGLTYTVVTPDTSAVATLAILAHEIGHTLWWNKGIPNLKCSGTTFHEITWKEPVSIPRGYHKFRERQSNEPSEDFDIDDMIALLQGGTPAQLNQLSADLQTVYQDANWVGLFSFVAPDEDFIETYKYWILQQAGFKTMDMKIPGQESVIHVMDNFNNASAGSGVGKKKAWIGLWLSDLGYCTEPGGGHAHP